jgi:lipopolysaccharide export system permease protein
MVVLRACGIGPSKLAGYVMVPAVIVMIGVAILSLYLAPEGSARAQILLDNPRSAEGLHLLNEGRFRKQRRGNYVTYTERIDDDGLMYNIFVFERQSTAGGEGFTATFAEQGEIVFEENSGRRYLELRGGSRYQGEPGALALEEITFSRYGELIPESQNSLRRTGKVDAIATEVLLRSPDPQMQGALWWRLSLPLMVPSIALIALALSPTDARRGRYAKLGPAMVVLLLYFLGLTQGRGSIENGDGPGFIVLVHGGFALLGLLLLQRERITKRWKGRHGV